MKRFVFLFLLIAFVSPAFGQAPVKFKVAALNVDSLLDIMPEMQAASDSLTALQKRIDLQLQDMKDLLAQKEYEYDSITKLHLWSPLITALKEKQIEDMRQNIKEIETFADEQYEARRKELFDPVMKKINAAAAVVAREKGYACVLDVSEEAGIVLYYDEAYNITADVCVKLGLKH